jgi:hypothetical protein
MLGCLSFSALGGIGIFTTLWNGCFPGLKGVLWGISAALLLSVSRSKGVSMSDMFEYVRLWRQEVAAVGLVVSWNT